jgi:hypothetical protein
VCVCDLSGCHGRWCVSSVESQGELDIRGKGWEAGGLLWFVKDSRWFDKVEEPRRFDYHQKRKMTYASDAN